MSVTLTTREGTTGQLEVTIQNSFNKAVLLPIGIIAGYEAYASRLRVIVTTGGEEHRAIFTGGPPAIAGRVDPLVIPLLPEAGYTVRTPVAQFYVLDGSESLEELLAARLAAGRVGRSERRLPTVRISQPEHDRVLVRKARLEHHRVTARLGRSAKEPYEP